MNQLDTALAYAARGWPVFPCKADKKPLTEHGYLDASTERAAIEAWWSEHPHALIGVDTGRAGLVIVDVDVSGEKPGRKNWAKLVDELGPDLEDTATTRTRSGGWHRYYQGNGHHVKCSEGALATAIDVKAEGGYVIAWDNWLDGHGLERLSDLPKALAERLAELEARHSGPAGPVAAVIHTGEGRHAALVSIAGTMRDRGLEPDEIAPSLLAFNKRRNDPPYPDAEVRKVADSMANYEPGDPDKGDPLGRELLTCLADVEPTAVTWLWPRRIPLAMPSILFGDAGLGKTHLALDIVARVSLGAAWPDGGRAQGGDVVVMSGEDDWATTIVPRLVYAGADLSRIYGFPAVEAFDEKGRRTFKLGVDAKILERELLAKGAVLAVVDPLTCFMGDVDTHRTSDVRVALSLLADVATRTGAAIVCVLHPNKDERAGMSALNRLSGSGAFGAAARSVMGIAADAKDDADERRLLLPVKLNVARKPPGLGYKIVSENEDSCDSGIAWDTDPVTVDADEAFGRLRPDTPAMTRAKAFLKRVLAGGEPYPSKVLEEQAEAEDVKPRTLKRAKAGLGVISEKDGFGPGAVWTCRLEAEP